MGKKPSMVWVLTDNLSKVLHATARLEPTQALRALGWDVMLISSGPGGKQQVRGIEVDTIPMANVYLLRQLIYHWRVLRFLWPKRHEIDVVFCHQISFMWLLPIKWWRWLVKGKRPLLVMDTRDINSADGGVKTKIRVQYYNFMHRLANWFADGQTAITPEMARMVQVPPDKLWGIWPSGVTMATFANAVRQRQWPQPDEPIHLMYIGRLHAERHLVPLCRAVMAANDQGSCFRLTLIGTGPQQVELEKMAVEGNGRIQIISGVAHQEIPNYLTTAHVGVTSMPPVNNRKFQASSPIKLFEYLAAGLPTFATRNVCHTQVVDGQPFAFWANDATQADMMAGLTAIWHARHDLPQLGQAALAAAQAWRWEASAHKISDALLPRIDHEKEPMVPA